MSILLLPCHSLSENYEHSPNGLSTIMPSENYTSVSHLIYTEPSELSCLWLNEPIASESVQEAFQWFEEGLQYSQSTIFVWQNYLSKKKYNEIGITCSILVTSWQGLPWTKCLHLIDCVAFYLMLLFMFESGSLRRQIRTAKINRLFWQYYKPNRFRYIGYCMQNEEQYSILWGICSVWCGAVQVVLHDILTERQKNLSTGKFFRGLQLILNNQIRRLKRIVCSSRLTFWKMPPSCSLFKYTCMCSFTLRRNSSPHCISSSKSAFFRYSIEWAD